ncbi:MAG: acyl-CoA dehydrogenase family protein [Candidatus Nanopelagicales bacterium]|nr:acyl-CoA dehydrogenase family protein [Candidatus Nanopelagicales bacterium]
MGGGFSEDHERFRSAVRAFVDSEITPNVTAWEKSGQVPRALFNQLGELGYLGVRISEECGGGGCDFRFTTVLVQELVRCGSVGVAVSVMVHAEFATKVIDRVGSDDLKNRFVRPAVSGSLVGALGITEPEAGSDVGAIRTRAVRVGDEYVINGSKSFITNGTIADYVTLAVRTGEPGPRGISLIIVPSDTPGLKVGRRLRKIGVPSSDTAELFFQDCHVPVANLIGEENRGFQYIMSGFEGERLVLAIIACAQMRLMFDEAREYGLQRQAFGHPLLGFQVWRHRLADALTKIEAAEALTYRAIDMHVSGVAANAEISMAKLFAAETCVGVAHDCAQIFGGNAFMEEQLIARLHRDSSAFSIGAGTSEVMREIIAATKGLTP